MQPKYVSLETWAAAQYDPVPSLWVLRKWRRDGEIHPPPQKVGKEWRVLETARRITGAEPAHGGLLAQLGA